MLLGVPLSELFWLALAIIIAGVITGLLAGLFGIGGGAIIVPVLYEVFRLLGVPEEVRMQLFRHTEQAKDLVEYRHNDRPAVDAEQSGE